MTVDCRLSSSGQCNLLYIWLPESDRKWFFGWFGSAINAQSTAADTDSERQIWDTPPSLFLFRFFSPLSKCRHRTQTHWRTRNRRLHEKYGPTT